MSPTHYKRTRVGRKMRLCDLGEVFTYLTVVGFDFSDKDVRAYCSCVCGNLKSVRICRLRNGDTRSCGCKRGELRGKREPIYGSAGEAGIRQEFSRYKTAAKKRELVFELAFSTFRTLVTSDCYYCGASPARESIPRGNRTNAETIEFGTSLVGGVDRVDNSMGYTDTNVVPCCATCNRMKGTLSKSEFLGHIGAIQTFRNKNVSRLKH